MEDNFCIQPRLQHDIIPDQEREDAKSTEKRTDQPSSEVARPCARIANWPTRLLTSILSCGRRAGLAEKIARHGMLKDEMK